MWILEDCCSLSMAEYCAKAEKINGIEMPPSDDFMSDEDSDDDDADESFSALMRQEYALMRQEYGWRRRLILSSFWHEQIGLVDRLISSSFWHEQIDLKRQLYRAEAERINGLVDRLISSSFWHEQIALERRLYRAEAERINGLVRQEYCAEAEEIKAFKKGGKDPGHDGQGYQDFTQRWDFVLDAEAHILRMTALAA